MTTIDLATEQATVDDILSRAEQESVMLRTASGKVFVVTELEPSDAEDDFATEVALTRQNEALRAMLAERSKEPGIYS
jgi:hypothetical protein